MASAQEAEQIVRGLTGKPAKRRCGSSPRFVFELLRNSEDKQFSKAAEEGSPPFISFKIYPTRIIVDCNEDGLTKSDLEAICAVGKDIDNTNEVGFRSVFTVASRVHIQSGNFSFELQHDNIDTDAGMMRPIWVTPTETIPGPLTRTTLYLHDQSDEQDIEQLRKTIEKEFGDLQETSLLFFGKLQKIIVEFYNENSTLDRSKQFRKQKPDKYRVSLETISIKGGVEMIQDQIYHVTKRTVASMPSGDNGKPLNQGALRVSSTPEVILAFPLSSEFIPLSTHTKQQIFAFSPLRASNYKFHIHSDFDVDANRQNIITTSKRNRRIGVTVSYVLQQAIMEFIEHPTLCYDWPLFLPPVGEGDSFDEFWSDVNRWIQRNVKKTLGIKSHKSVKSHKLNWFHFLDELVILPQFARNEDGQPLLDDPDKERYISPDYTETTVKILQNYGLESLSEEQFLDLLEADLSNNDSKTYGENTTDEWHAKMADTLSFLARTSKHNERLKSLPILPLRDGTWTSSQTEPVYPPEKVDIFIPESLELRVLSPSACSNKQRRALSQQLGAIEATVDRVRKSIMESFASSTELSLGDIQSYLHYLYLTHQTGPYTPADYSNVRVMDISCNDTSPRNRVVYLPGTDHPYSPESLWYAQDKSSNLSACLLHPDILKDVPAQPSLCHPTWSTWLRDYIGVRDRLSLLSPGGDELSHVFLYVLEHRPSIFLGLFEHLWIPNMTKVLKCRAVVTQIQNLPAKDLCGVNFATKLQETWLPRKSLKRIVERYMECPGYFPFLKVEDDTDLRLLNKWNFLKQYFSVGNFDNMDFLLQILRCIGRSRPKAPKVFDLYVAISSRLAIFEDQEAMRQQGMQQGMRQKIRAIFENEVILVPYENEPVWTSSSSCLWAAPPKISTVHSLRYLYNQQSLRDEHRKCIDNLFRGTLGIRDATMSDVVAELDVLRREGCEDFPRILGLYRYLDEEVASSADMRVAFEESPLILAEQHGVSGWYSTSDCLWSSTIAVRGKVTLGKYYGELKDLFVNKLGVMSLTPQMVYDELRQPSQRNIEETKMALFALNEFLEAAPIYLDPEPVRKAKIFPVRYPDATFVLGSIEMDFAIGDRGRLRAKFENKINLLDFDLGDVRRLKPFFDWLKLKDRYLSKWVRENTSISKVELPISSKKRDLKYKAYHIARVAATFSSPRFLQNASLLYDQLRTMRVVEVDQISSVLSINQNGQTFEADIATASDHIAELEGKLMIYVPKERKAQEICFGSTLPRRFAAWLMRDPESCEDRNVDIEAVNALTSIFASERCALGEILEDQGILHVSFENEDEGETDGDEEDDEDVEGDEKFHNALETVDDSPGQDTVAVKLSKDDSLSPEPHRDLTETKIDGVSQKDHTLGRARPGPQNVPPALSTSSTVLLLEDTEYCAILDYVIEAAQKARFPRSGLFDLQDLTNALSDGASNETLYEGYNGLSTTLTIHSMEQWERTKRIGAAGQLYVFELLSKFNLPGWELENWQSSIRTATTIHPKYTNMPKSTRKLSDDERFGDLTYRDFEGQLTGALIRAGVLIRNKWSEKGPKYHIFVRTTTGPFETPIYRMKDQYKQMQHMSFKRSHEEVCLIFQVYYLLDCGKINYSVYLDYE